MRNCLLHFPLVNKVADITDVHVCSAPQRSKREGIFQTSITSPLKSMDLFLKHFRWQRRVPWTKALWVRRVAQSSGCVHSQLTPLLSGLPDWFGTAWMGKAESWAGAATAISTHMYLWVLRLKVCLVMRVSTIELCLAWHVVVHHTDADDRWFPSISKALPPSLPAIPPANCWHISLMWKWGG